MRIVVNTFGSRGDIQPYIALGLGLQSAGHSVRIVTHHIFEAFVRQHGLDACLLDIDPRQVLANQALAELGNNTVRINRWMQENFRPALRAIFKVTLEAAQGADLMLNSGLSFAGWHVAERLHMPALGVSLWPMIPSRHLPPFIGAMPPAWLPFRGEMGYWYGRLANQLFFALLMPAVNQCRKEILNLAPMRMREYWRLDSPRTPASMIYGFSPTVIPKPPDWGDNQQIAGYWFLDEAKDYKPPPSLMDFLEAGPPPVCIGFGSMVEQARRQLEETILEALAAGGQRAVILGGWSDLGSRELPNSIFRLEAVPHDWFFPRVAAVIHHGGAGTTAAGLRAGRSSVIVPSFGDQFFWGARVAKLGAGPPPIPRNKLTAGKLARAIQQVVSSQAIRTAATQIGRRIEAEDGIEAAVGMIERFARSGNL